MSHISTVEGEVKDLECVKTLCKEKGWQFMEGQKTYKWFGEFVGDSPMPKGMTEADLGKCDHAIKVPGARYEIGLRWNADKGCYTLAFDWWVEGKLAPIIGKDGGKFMQGYGLVKAEKLFKNKGLHTKRVAGKAPGSIKLVCVGN